MNWFKYLPSQNFVDSEKEYEVEFFLDSGCVYSCTIEGDELNELFNNLDKYGLVGMLWFKDCMIDKKSISNILWHEVVH